MTQWTTGGGRSGCKQQNGVGPIQMSRPHVLESGLTVYREADILSGIMAENWAERIRAAFRAADLSMLALSREAGVPYAVVHDFMTGKGNANLRNAERICRVVGLDLGPVRRGKRRK